jgi:hypothetical protein
MNIVESQNTFILHLSSKELNALVRAIDEVCKKFSKAAFLTIINCDRDNVTNFFSAIKQKNFISSSAVTEQKFHVYFTLRELVCLQNILANICKIDKKEIEQIVGIKVSEFEEMFYHLKSFNAKHKQDIFVYQPQIDRKNIRCELDLVEKPRKICELYTELYEIKLYLQKLFNARDYIGVVITLKTLVEPYEMTQKTCVKAISLSQLGSLIDYFNEIFLYQYSCNFPISLSVDFLDIFKIKVFKDEDFLNNPDVVIMEFLINLGKSSFNYLNVKSPVAVSEIKKFSESIHDALQVLR